MWFSRDPLPDNYYHVKKRMQSDSFAIYKDRFMAAETKTNAYLLGNATLMIAPFGSIDPFAMTPDTYSLGMVKNVTLGVEADNIELRHGIQQNLIDSHRSNVRTTVSAEVYEYTAQNLFYGLSIDQTAVAPKRGLLKNAVTGPVATIIVNTNPLPNQPSTGISAVGDIPIGSTILIQKVGSEDYVYPVRVTATTTVSTGDYTVTVAIPTGIAFAAGDTVWVVNELPLGDLDESDYFQVKAVGVLSNYDKPMALILPKVKIRTGFNINFSETDYGNMPFQFDPFYLNSTELSGRLTEIGTTRLGYLYAV
jgi:hypothetical protein